jgi:hypothetical protein
MEQQATLYRIYPKDTNCRITVSIASRVETFLQNALGSIYVSLLRVANRKEYLIQQDPYSKREFVIAKIDRRIISGDVFILVRHEYQLGMDIEFQPG